MTVQSTLAIARFAGNGVAIEFPFTFKVTDPDHLEVLYVGTDGASAALTQGYHYEVTLNEDGSGGKITMIHDIPPIGIWTIDTGEELIVSRVVPLTQLTDLENQGGYFPDTLENTIDQLTMISQQQQEQLDRSLKVTKESGLSGDALIETVLDAARSSAQYLDTLTAIDANVSTMQGIISTDRLLAETAAGTATTKANEAAASAATATTKAGEASASATAASGSATTSTTKAGEASASATAASGSATTATTKAGEAATSATAASNAALSAQGYNNAASIKASEALVSAEAAADSAADAAASLALVKTQVMSFAAFDAPATGDKAAWLMVPFAHTLVSAYAVCKTKGSSQSTIQLYRATQTSINTGTPSWTSLLSTAITLDNNKQSSAASATQPVVDAAKVSGAAGDHYKMEFTGVGTGVKDVTVVLKFGMVAP